jgi:hypothetical protein
MKNTLKGQTLNHFIDILEKNHSDLEEYKRRAIACELNEIAYEMLKESIKFFSDSQNEKSIELEQHRKLFHDHILMIEKNVKTILDSFKKQGFVKVEMDNKTNRNKLKGRTTMVDELVVFLNNLNKIVVDFYKDIYRIENKHQAKEFGVEQISLF